MKYNVMILDDEYIILDGLCSFPWEDYDCQVTVTARNGLEGLEKIKDNPVDLILTDIRMPGMDGLVFSREVKKLYPDVTIIILSGYDNFTYAKQAIQIGVEEYLLKPIDFDQMKGTIKKVTDRIREKNDEKKYVQDLRRYFERSLPQLRARFVFNILHGWIQDGSEIEAQKASLRLTLDKYIVCIGKKVSVPGHMDRRDDWIEEFGFINIFEEIFRNYGIDVLSDYDSASMEYNFILPFALDAEDKDCFERTIKACEMIQEQTKKYCNILLNFGLSDVSDDDTLMNRQYMKAQVSCSQSMILGSSVIIKYDDLNLKNDIYRNLTVGEKSHLMLTLFQSDFEAVRKELEEIFSGCQDNIADMKLSALDLLFSSMMFPYTGGLDRDIQSENRYAIALSDGVKRLLECSTKEDILDCIVNCLSVMVRQNTDSTNERNERLVHNICEYIDQYYAQDISMDTLSDKFHVSRSYISRLMKHYSGQSFLEYLNDIRFSHVEQLMKGTSLKQYEIAEKCGFRDFGYYIKSFKKRYGVTPNEYRRNV